MPTDGDLGTYSAQSAERAGEWRSSAVTTGMMLLGCGQVRVTGQELSRLGCGCGGATGH